MDYTLILKWEGVSASSPQAAAEEVWGWLQDSKPAFEVIDEATNEMTIVDFEERPLEEQGFALENLVNGNVSDAIEYLKGLKSSGFKDTLLIELHLIQESPHISPERYTYILSQII